MLHKRTLGIESLKEVTHQVTTPEIMMIKRGPEVPALEMIDIGEIGA